MAASELAQSWTAIVVMDEDASLTGAFKVLPNTRLSDVMQMWKDTFDLFGNWVFVSANNDVTFNDDQITLEGVGETAPRMVYLRTAFLQMPTSEIFVHLKDKCHHLVVESNETLGEALERLPGRPKFLEYNGLPLDLNQTVQQAGLPNKSVIYEPLCSIIVKLSSKDRIFLQLPSNCLVHHLKETVKLHESGDFSLVCRGKHLKSDQLVAQLKHVVEVSTSEFGVNFNDRRISWITKSEPISLPEFRAQLSVEGDIDTQLLETVVFACVGCQRRIYDSDDYVQQLPAECCIEKSLTLNAIFPPNTDSGSESNDLTKLIQSLRTNLVQCRKGDSRTQRSRHVSRGLEENFRGERLDYNAIIQSSETLLRSADGLEDKIKKLEADIKKLTTKNKDLKKQLRGPRTLSLISIQKTDTFSDEKTNSDDSLNRVSGAISGGRPTVITPPLPKSPSEQPGIKLLVFYKSPVFSPGSSSKVEARGMYTWSAVSHIKCCIPKIRTVGPITFKALHAVLKPLFTGPDIRSIRQCRGFVDGEVVSEVTSIDEDDAVRPDRSPYMDNSPYCDDKGFQYSWKDAGEPRIRFIRKGEYVYLCGGGRRTVLTIDSKLPS